jgi:hypothetical protein
MYETYEETSNDKSSSEKRIKNIYDEPLIKNTKPGYNYNELDKNGIIKENTLMDEKNVLIGKIMFSKETPDDITDESIFPKKGQLGYVDKTYITENEEGRRIAKVRIREDRDPATGDKFASRCGQKGTIGNIISAENMPFTKDGIQPDLIINPHALPSRMTIGQFLESVFNKVACEKGCSIDNTAFLNKGSKYNETGALLNSYGYHSSGNELLYNGMTGEQIESEIFIGPTYYMRLKHMVKDKINYRAGGPRTLLTRQTNQGRANDGGLRIGEMERDGVIAHGMATFLYDAMMKRGDEYKVVICNHSGTIAIYNKEVNNFYSPIVDGPIQYDMDINNITPNIITKYGKEFSVVKIPYCFKLLIQELGAMNVQMRLITADNIDQLTVTGNTNLSEIIKSEVPTTLLSKRNVNQNVNIEKLSQLEEQYNTSMTNYNSRLKVLKQKFNKLTGKKPVNSYYKKELNDLRNKYLTNKETYYDLSKEIYKDEIDEIIEKLDELKVNYNSSLKLNKPIEIEKIKLEYNKYLKLFKKYTGEDYNVLLEDFKNISLAEPQLEPVIEQPKQSQPPVKKELATGPLVVKKMGNEASTAESSTTETSSAESNESNNGTSGNNESLSQESNESK